MRDCLLLGDAVFACRTQSEMGASFVFAFLRHEINPTSEREKRRKKPFRKIESEEGREVWDLDFEKKVLGSSGLRPFSGR